MTRHSTPYTEVLVGEVPRVQAGDRVERDDGWWRAVRITIRQMDRSPDYHSEIDWVPVEPETER